MKIKKYTNGAWTDLNKPVKKFDEYTDTATTLPLTLEASGTDAVENYKVYGASGGVGEATSGSEPQGYKIPLLISDGTNTSNYDLMLGSDKLYADEYVDFGEQKIYRTIALMTHDDKTFTTSDNNRFCVRRSNNG